MRTDSLTQYAKAENLGKLKQGSLGFINEFKAFAVKGNVVDMAVGIIIGAAFGKIVSSFVADVVMPPLLTTVRRPGSPDMRRPPA